MHARQQEVRWHLAPMPARITWPPEARSQFAGVLEGYFSDPSRSVEAEALEAVVRVTAGDLCLEERAWGQVEQLSDAGAPALCARARVLLRRRRHWWIRRSRSETGLPRCT